MNVIELMDLKISAFSKTDRRIYEALKKFPKVFANQSITDISNTSGFSKPALTRFAQKLGFSGFSEFQYQFNQDILTIENRSETPSNAKVYGNLFLQVDKTVDRQVIKELIDRMKDSDRVCIHGTHLSRLPAEELNIALQFESGIYAYFPPHDVLPNNFSEKDMLVVYSAINGDYYKKLMHSLRSDGIKKPYTLLITTHSKHPLRHYFDQTIVLPTTTLSQTTNIVLSDTFSFLMFNDILVQNLK